MVVIMLIFSIMFMYFFLGYAIMTVVYQERRIKNPLYKLPMLLFWPIIFIAIVFWGLRIAVILIKDWFIEVIDYYKDKKVK